MIYRSPNSIVFFNCPIRRTVTVKTRNIYKKTAWATTLMFYLRTYLVLYYAARRSLNDFFAKNRNETVKRKHDSNSDDDSADPNNNVTNVSEPVPIPAKKTKQPKNFKHQNITVQIMHSKQQQIEFLFHMLKKSNIYKNWTCEMRKMQFIFFVPPNEELKGTLHSQKFGCIPKNEGKRVHVPPDEKTCGHAVLVLI